jgi:hypothetical protein
MQHLSNRIGNSPDLRFGQRNSTRKIKAAPREPFGHGMGFARVETHFPEHRLLVHRPEKWPRLHVQSRQPKKLGLLRKAAPRKNWKNVSERCCSPATKLQSIIALPL